MTQVFPMVSAPLRSLLVLGAVAILSAALRAARAG